MLACRTCKTRFSERKGTPLFDTRLPEDKAVSVLNHIAEGMRRPKDRPPRRGEQGHRRPLQPAGRADTPSNSTTSCVAFSPEDP